jgi:hypothetical protein
MNGLSLLDSAPSYIASGRGKSLRLVTQSELEGNCRGWDGDTVFALSNGEVWKQDASRYHSVHLCSPAIRVWRLGARFLLEVEGLHEVLPVRRIL